MDIKAIIVCCAMAFAVCACGGNAVKGKNMTAEELNGLGMACLFGEGVEIDYEQAAGWFQLAAEKGSAIALYELAYLYDNGLGVGQNHVKSFSCLLESAEAGFATAQYLVGQNYFTGTNTEKDEKAAFEWYKKAADQGLVCGLTAVAECLEKGYGVAADPVEASKWYHKAVARYLQIKTILQNDTEEFRKMEEDAYAKALEGMARF